jgi:hypothetical protein
VQWGKWLVSSNGAQYLIKNAQYGTYISISTISSVNLVFAFGSLTPSPWIIQEYKGGFVQVSVNTLLPYRMVLIILIRVASPANPAFTFNLDGSVNLFGNATPVLAIVFFNLTISSYNKYITNSFWPSLLLLALGLTTKCGTSTRLLQQQARLADLYLHARPLSLLTLSIRHKLAPSLVV